MMFHDEEYKRLVKKTKELLDEFENTYDKWEDAKAHHDKEAVLKNLVELKIIRLKIATTDAEKLFLGYDPYSDDDAFYDIAIADGKICERQIKNLKKQLITEDEDLLEINRLERQLYYCGIFRAEEAEKDNLPELVRLSLQFARLDLELAKKKAILFSKE